MPATLEAAAGRVGGFGAAPPAPISFTHALDNAPWNGPTITSAPFAVAGGPLLTSGVPAGDPIVWINTGTTHRALVRSWALLTGVPATAGATVTAATAGGTTQDVNDPMCVTVCEFGPGAPLAVRAVVPPTSAQGAGAGQPVLYQPLVSFGGRLLIRACGSAQPGADGALVSLAIDLDGQEVARSEVLGATKAWHLATVPVDVLVDAAAGPHVIAIHALPGCFTDLNDYTSLVVLEEMGPPGAIAISPLLVNAPCMDQGGGGTAAFATFASGGGTLVIQVAASAFATTAAQPITLTVELDGQPLVLDGNKATLRLFANTAGMHVTLVSNDFVVPGISAGSHTLTLVADANTNTNGDDRCSITVLELGPAAA